MAAKGKRFDATSTGQGTAEEGGIGRTAKGAQGDTLIASHVGEMDMVRIREAEKVIDADEVKYGKYILDEVRTMRVQQLGVAFNGSQGTDSCILTFGGARTGVRVLQTGRVVPERVLFDHRSSMKVESDIRQKEKKRRAADRQQHMVRRTGCCGVVMAQAVSDVGGVWLSRC